MVEDVKVQKRIAFQQPWAGAAIKEWTNWDRAVVLNDMSKCEPGSALSMMRLKKGTWKVIPYEMMDGLKGNMIWAAEEAQAPELTLALKARGWYAIFVGIYCSYDFPGHKIWLRLDKNDTPVARINDWNQAVSRSPSFYNLFSSVKSSYNCGHGSSESVFYTVAELQEDTLLYLSQPRSMPKPCGVTHVTLVPLTQEEIDFVRADRADRSTRKLTVTNDTGVFSYLGGYPRVKEALAAVEELRNTDVGTILLHTAGIAGETVSYPSKVGSMGHMGRTDAELHPQPYYRIMSEAMTEMAKKGINPARLFIEEAHRIGLKVHVGWRPAGWSFFEPYCDYWETPFFKNHPEWRCADRDGTPVTRMSWAVPQVRKHQIDLFEEQLDFGPDGVHVVFNRGVPVVMYEPPAIELFKKQFGEDPRTIDEDDPRITQWWSGVVTTFFRELREMLDREQARRKLGKRLEISIMLFGDEKTNLRFGIDLRRLVAENLVDEVYPWGYEFPHNFEWPYKTHGFDLAFFRDVCGKKGIPFKPTICQILGKDNEDWLSLGGVRRFLESGANGIGIWDPGTFEPDIYFWSIFARMGHVEETVWRAEHLDVLNPPRTYHEFLKLGEHTRYGRIGVQWGG
jgi:hypothetical protein